MICLLHSCLYTLQDHFARVGFFLDGKEVKCALAFRISHAPDLGSCVLTETQLITPPVTHGGSIYTAHTHSAVPYMHASTAGR